MLVARTPSCPISLSRLLTPMHALPTLARPSLQQLASLLAASQPAVLTGLISHWPAFHSWTRQKFYGSLRTSGQGRTVDVEWSRKGRGYMDDGEKGRSQMDLGAYIDAFLLRRFPYREGRPAEEMVVYVAQQDLLNSVRCVLARLPIDLALTQPEGSLVTDTGPEG